MRYKVLPILLTLVLVFSCTGKRGPTGPQGLKGDTGDAGPGTRVVYTGTVPDDWAICSVTIPEISDPNNLPVVQVWIEWVEGWEALPTYFLYYGEYFDWLDSKYALVQYRKVNLYNCEGLKYQVVIVI